MKGASFLIIIVALIVDGIQATLSAGVFVIAAFPGTIGGAAIGCAVGNSVAGSLGCNVGGFVLGILGSIPFVNGFLAVATVPLGVLLGFVISICISMTFGAGLILLLILNRSFYPKYVLPGGVTEILPGFDLIPTWTALTIMCVLRKARDEKVAALASSVTNNFSSSDTQEASSPRTMDGIRGPAANDNNPPSAQRYAA